jgi:hypothetical protein
VLVVGHFSFLIISEAGLSGRGLGCHRRDKTREHVPLIAPAPSDVAFSVIASAPKPNAVALVGGTGLCRADYRGGAGIDNGKIDQLTVDSRS